MPYKELIGIPRSYSSILFIDHPILGLVFFLVTLWYPNIGIAGFISAFAAFVTARALQFPLLKTGLHIYNSLLVGLSLGAFYQLNIALFFFLILAGLSTVLVTVALVDILTRYHNLPALSLPFIAVAFIMALVTRSFPGLEANLALTALPDQLFTPIVNNFFSTMGAIFFTPHPLMGLILFLCVLVYSRYLALLAVCGYLSGYAALSHFEIDVFPSLMMWTYFNFSLTAIALGGIYTIPTIPSFVYAMIGSAIAAVVVISMKNLLLIYNLPVMALPFASTTIVMLIALKMRGTLSAPTLAVVPATPEVNYERARLSRVRNGELNSVPVLLPFYGEWQIYQGFQGKHTHQSLWQHALDFFIVQSGMSFENDGHRLEDYYCYKLPVLSPVYGDVARTYDKLNDNPPGEVDTENNWGNFILIRLHNGQHVLLAHLAKDSIKVKEGDRLKPGQVIAACGNSGRSPQPHLHLQVQQDARLGSPTVPFHLASVVLKKSQGKAQYQVVCVPDVEDSVQAADPDPRIAANMHLPVGKSMKYDLSSQSRKRNGELYVELTLSNQFRLKSDCGASCAFTESNGVLAFYDRDHKNDMLLDSWVLANGLTPLTDQAHYWEDSPSAVYLPLNLMQKILLNLFRPLGCGLNSTYERHWEDVNQEWNQQGRHVLNLGLFAWEAKTLSIIDPEKGCHFISVEFNGKSWRAELTDLGLKSDQGIPGWRETEKNVSWG